MSEATTKAPRREKPRSGTSGAWLAEVLSRLEVRYPEIRVVFCESRSFAEEWTYRFLSAALADADESGQ